MSGDDELERLLREVDATLSGSPGAVSKQTPGKEAATGSAAAPSRRGRPLRTGAIAGAICGAGVFVGTTLLSWLPGDQAAFQSGVGAFVGAFLTGAVLSARRGS